MKTRKKQNPLQHLLGDQEIGLWVSRSLSLILLTLAVVLLWIPYRERYFLFFTREKALFRPDLLSSLTALMLILPLYLRRIFTFDKLTVYNILSLLLRFTLTASFCRILMGDGPVEGVWMILTACLTALSWLGIRSAGPLVWAAFLLVSLVNLLTANNALGINGFICVAAGIVGIILGERLTLPAMGRQIWEELRGPPSKEKL